MLECLQQSTRQSSIFSLLLTSLTWKPLRLQTWFFTALKLSSLRHYQIETMKYSPRCQLYTACHNESFHNMNYQKVRVHNLYSYQLNCMLMNWRSLIHFPQNMIILNIYGTPKIMHMFFCINRIILLVILYTNSYPYRVLILYIISWHRKIH